MSKTFIRRVLAPLNTSRRRKRMSFLYRNPLDFVRRVYLHLEQTIFKHTKVLVLPTRAKLNTGYTCNLRCPLCPTGIYDPSPSGRLTASMAQTLLPRLNGVRTISLFGWAEPFLNPEIFEIIDHLKKHGKTVAIDSNLSIKNADIIEKLAQTPIDMLSVSMDGADEESYAKYRVGGSFELVIQNIRTLKASEHGPLQIQWQYLVSRKNQHLVERARELGSTLGVEMSFMDIGMYNDMFYESTDDLKREWWTDEQMEQHEKPQANTSESCMYMYNDPFIDVNGDVYPCCHAPYAPQAAVDAGFDKVFGNLNKNSLREIWNNEHYQAARALFKDSGSANTKVKTICLRCRLYLQRSPGSVKSTLPVFSGGAQQTPMPASPQAPGGKH